MEIDCGSFLLRPLRMADKDSMARYANNYHIWRYVRDRFPHPYSVDDAVAFLSQREQVVPVTDFCIEYNQECIGVISMMLQTDIHRRSAEIGYWLGEPFWGKGIATTATRNLIPYAFREFDIVRLYAGIIEGNTGSMRVLEKAGFRFDCIFEQAVFKDNRLCNEHRYSLLKHW